MQTTELIAKVAAFVRPLMTAYDSDLDVDLQEMANHAELPFLHWTRKTGTDLAFLWPADHEKYPKAGQRVAYLFGTCDRRELARKPIEHAEYWQINTVELVLYYDGNTLRKITPNQALDVAQCYFRQTVRAWQPKGTCVYCDR